MGIRSRKTSGHHSHSKSKGVKRIDKTQSANDLLANKPTPITIQRAVNSKAIK